MHECSRILRAVSQQQISLFNLRYNACQLPYLLMVGSHEILKGKYRTVLKFDPLSTARRLPSGHLK